MQELEQLVWQMPHSVPLHQLVTVAKNGGILLGAFAGSLMVGLLYSFPGYLGRQVYLCSHMLGIREGWRKCGLGKKLKLAQAEAAKALGYSLVTWTYDPLESVNANLNISKLGAVCSTYIVNCYGEMNDSLNQGLPSDRFQVAWWLNQPPAPRLPQGLACEAVCWQLREQGLIEPVETAELTADILAKVVQVTVVVPADIQAMKIINNDLAKTWRLVTRQAFVALFAAGWAVAGFRRLPGIPVNEYILVRLEQLGLTQPPWEKD
ncbi:GNAT family N-acetyltransferase [Sporomusa termitida]|nr:GNAT family N-acetyltransferase [Sporomusa termitida]